jgi:predicted metal-dependent peptidase
MSTATLPPELKKETKAVRPPPDRLKISEGVLKIYQHERFLSHILLQRIILVLPDELYPEKVHKTACTDGASVWFHEDFLIGLSPPEAAYIILHEGLHIALMHRKVTAELEQMLGQKPDHELINYCLDIFVNRLCDKIAKRHPDSFKDDGKGISIEVVHKDYPGILPQGFEDVMDSIQVYMILKDQPKPPGRRSGKTVFLLVSPDGVPGSTGKKEIDDVVQKQIERAIRLAQIKSKSDRTPGTEPGELEELISKLLEPVPNLGDFLRTKLLGNQKIEKDFNRPARNAAWMSGPGRPIYPRFKKGPWQRVAEIVDTSGSMSADDIAHILDVTAGILDQAKKNHVGTELHLWGCDVESHKIGVYKRRRDMPEKLPVFGRGGTSFRYAIEKVIEAAKKGKWDPQCTTIIYVTDSFGDAETMQEPPLPVIWIVPKENTKGVEKRLPWGSILSIHRGRISIIRRN